MIPSLPLPESIILQFYMLKNQMKKNDSTSVVVWKCRKIFFQKRKTCQIVDFNDNLLKFRTNLHFCRCRSAWGRRREGPRVWLASCPSRIDGRLELKTSILFPNDYPIADILKSNCKTALAVCKFRDSDTIYHSVASHSKVCLFLANSTTTTTSRNFDVVFQKKSMEDMQKFWRIIRELETFKFPSFHSGRFDERKKSCRLKPQIFHILLKTDRWLRFFRKWAKCRTCSWNQEIWPFCLAYLCRSCWRWMRRWEPFAWADGELRMARNELKIQMSQM